MLDRFASAFRFAPFSFAFSGCAERLLRSRTDRVTVLRRCCNNASICVPLPPADTRLWFCCVSSFGSFARAYLVLRSLAVLSALAGFRCALAPAVSARISWMLRTRHISAHVLCVFSRALRALTAHCVLVLGFLPFYYAVFGSVRRHSPPLRTFFTAAAPFSLFSLPASPLRLRTFCFCTLDHVYHVLPFVAHLGYPDLFRSLVAFSQVHSFAFSDRFLQVCADRVKIGTRRCANISYRFRFLRQIDRSCTRAFVFLCRHRTVLHFHASAYGLSNAAHRIRLRAPLSRRAIAPHHHKRAVYQHGCAMVLDLHALDAAYLSRRSRLCAAHHCAPLRGSYAWVFTSLRLASFTQPAFSAVFCRFRTAQIASFYILSRCARCSRTLRLCHGSCCAHMRRTLDQVLDSPLRTIAYAFSAASSRTLWFLF